MTEEYKIIHCYAKYYYLFALYFDFYISFGLGEFVRDLWHRHVKYPHLPHPDVDTYNAWLEGYVRGEKPLATTFLFEDPVFEDGTPPYIPV